MTDWSPMLPYREKLDALDEEIIRLFAQRYALRREIHEVKKQNDLPLQDNARVEEVVARAVKNAEKYDVPMDFAEALYRLVIEYSHRFEDTCKS